MHRHKTHHHSHKNDDDSTHVFHIKKDVKKRRVAHLSTKDLLHKVRDYGEDSLDELLD